MMSTPKSQGVGKRIPFHPPVTVTEEDDMEDDLEDDRKKDDSEDDFWRDPLSFLSSGSSTEPNKHNPQRLVTNQTSQGDLDGKLVSNQSSPSLCNQEEEDHFEEAPWLETVHLSPQLGLNGAI